MSQLNPPPDPNRLTLRTRLTRPRTLPQQANLPTFSRPPKTPSPIRPIPKPKIQPKIKPPPPPKPPKGKPKEKEKKISSYQKKLQKARAERFEKQEVTLPEPEDGEYDAQGFWVEKERPVDEAVAESGYVAYEERQVDQLRLRGGAEDADYRAGDGSSAPPRIYHEDQAQTEAPLTPMGTDQLEGLDDLFDLDRNYFAPTTDTGEIPAASTRPAQAKRKRSTEPTTLNEVSTSSTRSQIGTGMDQDGHVQYRLSAMRDSDRIGNDPDEGEPIYPMPRSAQSRLPDADVDREGGNEYFDGNYDSHNEIQLSPTEINSSAMRDPVSRSQTRRSNDRSKIYSLERGDNLVEATPSDEQREADNLPRFPVPSFALSDSQPTQTQAQSIRSLSAPINPRPQKVKTYSKSSKSVPSRRIHPTSPTSLGGKGFKDLFSPEPEWEEQHRYNDKASGRVDKSKRAGSTSWWPSTPGMVSDEGDDTDDDDDERDEEPMIRHILGDIQVNEKGQRIARGRGRNGEWPEGRELGLFGEQDELYDRYHKYPELYRPLTERFHLVKQEPPDTPNPDIKPERRHNHRANYDRPIIHPDPVLTMRREKSVAGRLDDYTLKINSRQTRHQDRVPHNPVVHTNIKSRIKPIRRRRSKFDIPNLPPSVLKPIDTLPANEYKERLKSRIAGDGFVNPVLIKAGRLGTRDIILRKHQQSRIRQTGKGRAGVKTQTPIIDEKGDPDPIIVSQATQDPVSRHRSAGFGVRQHERVKAKTKRYQQLHPKLPFTSQSPSPQIMTSDTSTNGHRLRYTALSPPRRRPAPGIFPPSASSDWDEQAPTAVPALPVPGLAGPRVGFGSRYKKQKHVDFDDPQTELPPDGQVPPTTATTSEGYLRRRSGYWQPPPLESGVVYSEKTPQELGDGVGRIQQSGHEEVQEPLFLSHDQGEGEHDHDLDSNSSRPDPISFPVAATEAASSTGLSGAQLCTNLLQSALNIPLPKPHHGRQSNTRREEKRQEMARRLKDGKIAGRNGKEVESTGKTGVTGKDTPLFDVLEEELEMDVDDYQPTTSQLERRKEFGLITPSNPITGTQQIGGISGEVDNSHSHSTTQLPKDLVATQVSSFQSEPGPPARNPGRLVSTPATPAFDALAATAATSKLRKRTATSKYFQPPKPINKTATGAAP